MIPATSLTFFGALEEVTGSLHLGECQGDRWIVDCGLIQGSRRAEEANYGPWPQPPHSLTTALLTHAHLDHCGRFPKLVHDGFSGTIHCTPATRDLAKVVMMDAARLSAEEAKYRRKLALRKGKDPAEDPFCEPLYTPLDVADTLRRMRTHQFRQWATITDHLAVRFHDAGHILGSAHVELRLEGGGPKPVHVLYSGDIGRYGVVIQRDPNPPPRADLVVMESTYGDREHPPQEVGAQLAAIVKETYERGGVLVMPAFAVSRTQSLLWHLASLEEAGFIPIQPVFLDSPMARQTTALYQKYPDILDPPHDGGGMRLPRQYSEVVNQRDSKRLNERYRPCIIIAGSGMLGGGRILHHIKQRAPVRENTICFTGFQAPGTLGRRVLEGAAEIHLLGTDVPIRAQVQQITGLSAHADRRELIRWAAEFDPPPSRCFLVHGDPEAKESLAEELRAELGWTVEIPPFNTPLPLDELM